MSNHTTARTVPSVCTCESLGASAAPANDSLCAEMLKGCGGGPSVAWVAVPLLVLLLVFGVGCVWCWKRRDAPRDATRQAILRFWRRSHSRRDCPKTPSLSPRLGSSRYKVTAHTRGRGSAKREAHLGEEYENMEARPPPAEEASEGLYENAQQACRQGPEEPVYGNQVSPDYCNFQKPTSPQAPLDEDIYIIPD